MWDPSFLIEPESPAVEAQSLNHWAAKEVLFSKKKKKKFIILSFGRALQKVGS